MLGAVVPSVLPPTNQTWQLPTIWLLRKRGPVIVLATGCSIVTVNRQQDKAKWALVV